MRKAPTCKAGQVLFQIDPDQLQASLGQSQAALASAEATYANAKAAADRARRLAPPKFVSQSDLDNALAAERSAGAAVKQAKAALADARINLGYATVRAPISGRAGKQQVTEGALVGQDTATLLTTVDQIDPLYVNFSVSVTELEQIRRAAHRRRHRRGQGRGDPARRHARTSASAPWISPATWSIRPPARSRCARASPIRTSACCPARYVTLKATLGEQANAFLVPQVGLQRDATSAYVLVVGNDGKVARKDVVDRSPAGAATGWSAAAWPRATRSSSPASSARSPASRPRPRLVAARRRWQAGRRPPPRRQGAAAKAQATKD